MLELDWYKCHGEGWTGEIVPDAFSHPAKFSRALIKRIYEHCIERGWLKENSVVLDPFGGVGLGGYHALQNGMHWLGVELEPAFVRLGSGYDCPGFSQADWKYGQRVDEAKQAELNVNLCPTCQKTIVGYAVLGQALEQCPHRYEGNIDLWNRRYGGHFRKWGTARLVQGDSRELREVVGGMVDGVCTSPPWEESIGSDKRVGKAASYTGHRSERYGKSDGQLGQMSPGNADAVITSSPYANSLGRTSSINTEKIKRPGGPHSQAHAPDTHYGQADGQLGAMPEGNADAVITSSPYLGTVASDDPDKRGGLYKDPKRRDDVSLTATYGESEGQLAGMEEGDLILTSPPYADAVNAHGEGPGMAGHKGERQRIIDGNPGEHAAQSRGVGYGKSDGQLAAMPAGEVDGVVTSPPYEGSQIAQQRGDCGGSFRKDGKGGATNRIAETLNYGKSGGQMGATAGATFWSAARIIVAECYEILKPGGVAIFVVKSFVRKKKIVDFPGQWQRLCESVGFETIEFIRAWLIEERGSQYDLFGELHTKTVQHKSFFRLLSERKGSPRIDFEVVLVMQKRKA